MKENVNFQSEDIRDEPVDNMAIITTHLQQMENEIQGASLMKETEEVSVYVSGYITKKLIKRFHCKECNLLMLSGDQNSIEDKYTKLLNRGGLMIPSLNVCSFASKCFAMLDIIYEVLLKYSADGIRNSAEYYLEKYSPPIVIGCPDHDLSCRKWLCRIVTNIYINNDQKISNAEVRKDVVKQFKSRQIEKRKLS